MRNLIKVKFKKENGKLSRTRTIQITKNKKGKLLYQSLNQSITYKEKDFIFEKDFPTKKILNKKINIIKESIKIAIRIRDLNLPKIYKPHVNCPKRERINPITVIVFALKKRIKQIFNKVINDTKILIELVNYKLKNFKGKTMRFFVKENEKLILKNI